MSNALHVEPLKVKDAKLQIRLPKSLLDALRKHAKRKKTPASDVIRQLLEQYLKGAAT